MSTACTHSRFKAVTIGVTLEGGGVGLTFLRLPDDRAVTGKKKKRLKLGPLKFDLRTTEWADTD